LNSPLKEDPSNAGAEAKLGIVALKRGDKAEAERHFRTALQLQPDELDALSGMATLSAQAGEKTRAIEFPKRAIHAGPLDEHLHYRMAELYRSVGDLSAEQEALKQYREIKALRGKTDLADVAANLGVSLSDEWGRIVKRPPSSHDFRTISY
jgi:Tfp pilus assembly protein PilF